jgi:hypothetical protein
LFHRCNAIELNKKSVGVAMNLYQLSKMFVLGLGIFSTCLFASHKQPDDTDQLMQGKNPSWLTETIAPMSARDQLDAINTFKAEINAHRQQTNYVLPLGSESKEKLKSMSSWMYSNLIAESFNQEDLPAIIECAISLSECFFSNHYLFDALEYQLWTYNHEPPGLGDLGYTRLFYAMAQSRYFPKQQTFGASSSSHPGFDFHKHLSVIVEKKRTELKEPWIHFDAKRDIAQTLSNIIIAYNMMSGEEFSAIRDEFHSKSLAFPLDEAIDALLILRNKHFSITAIPNSKNLYKSLLLDFICKTESDFSASACFDSAQEMPAEFLGQRQLILDMRQAFNNNSSQNNEVMSQFERKVGEQLATLGAPYNLENNVYDPDLCCEIDFVVTNTETGTVTRIETDGYFHFNQNFHGVEITQDLNGITRLQTNLLRKFGKVLRISGACDNATYKNRIKGICQNFKKFEGADLRTWFLPPSHEYASCIK